MGDNPRLRNKYSRPKRLWDKDRIAEESKIKRTFGLKNMRELWSVKTKMLDKYRRQARLLLSKEQEVKELKGKPIIRRLAKLGVMKPDSNLEDILTLSVQDFLERRLQTIVFRKGFAKTINQARQMIVHGHVVVGDRVVNRPSFIVDLDVANKVNYVEPVKKKHHHEEVKEEQKEENKSEQKEEVKEEKKEEKKSEQKKEQKTEQKKEEVKKENKEENKEEKKPKESKPNEEKAEQ